MTLTPQERTELQRLAELCSPEEWYDPDDLVSALADKFGSSKGNQVTAAADAAFIAACSPAAILALLSLAAESEELRAELEKERAENKMLRCEHVNQQTFHDGSIKCLDCSVPLWPSSRIPTRRNPVFIADLESRYSALETAARDLDAQKELDGKHALAAKRLHDALAALTPKEGE